MNAPSAKNHLIPVFPGLNPLGTVACEFVSQTSSHRPDDETNIRMEWVLGFIDGEIACFEAIFRIEASRMWRFIYKSVRAEDSAEDIQQEVWFEAWQNRKRLRKPESFLSWLYGIARQRIALYYRKRNQNFRLCFFGDVKMSENFVENLEDDGPGPDHAARQTEWRKVFDQELDALDTVSQEIISYRFGAGLSLGEIAELMDIPVKTVGTRIYRSLDKIRKNLDKKGIDYPF